MTLQARPTDQVQELRDVRTITGFDDGKYSFAPPLRKAGRIPVQPTLVVKQAPKCREVLPRPIDSLEPLGDMRNEERCGFIIASVTCSGCGSVSHLQRLRQRHLQRLRQLVGHRNVHSIEGKYFQSSRRRGSILDGTHDVFGPARTGRKHFNFAE